MFEATFHFAQRTAVMDPRTPGVEQHLLKLVADTDDRNCELWNGSIPSAGLELGSLPPEVSLRFELGQKYRLTIEPIRE